MFPRYFARLGGEGFDQSYRAMQGVGALSLTAWIAVMALSGLLEGG